MSAGRYQKFLIVGVQRTGSSALAEVINTHPAIATGWEWTERIKPWKKLQVLSEGLTGNFSGLEPASREHIERSIGPDTLHLGFRRLFGASNKWVATPATSAKLLLDRFRPHMRWLAKNPDVRVIHIVRDNHVEWLKSKYVARELSSFVGQAYPENIQVTVPLRDALSRVRAKIWVDAELARIAQTNPYLQLRYEQFSKQMSLAGSEAVSFLGEDPRRLRLEQTSISKQSTKSTADYLTNYDELVAALQTI